MIIRNQARDKLYILEKFDKIFVQPVYESGSGYSEVNFPKNKIDAYAIVIKNNHIEGYVGYYISPKIAEHVIDMLYEAVSRGDLAFTMPRDTNDQVKHS